MNLPIYNSKEWLSLTDFDGELWKSIDGYENLYQVSNYGRVKSLPRQIVNGRGGVYKNRMRILKYKRSREYDSVALYNNGIVKYFRVARLVASAFIPNTDNLPQVNHKDCNVHNNQSDNLEWCTAKYNTNYAEHNKRLSESMKRYFDSQESRDKMSKIQKEVRKRPLWKERQRIAQQHNSKCKQVFQFTKDGTFVASYHSQKEAERKTGIKAQNIGFNINNPSKQSHAGGYIWKNKENT